MSKVIERAQQVVANKKLKADMENVLKESSDDLKDIVLIFVTTDWEVDAYWTNLEPDDVKSALTSFMNDI